MPAGLGGLTVGRSELRKRRLDGLKKPGERDADEPCAATE